MAATDERLSSVHESGLQGDVERPEIWRICKGRQHHVPPLLRPLCRKAAGAVGDGRCKCESWMVTAATGVTNPQNPRLLHFFSQ